MYIASEAKDTIMNIEVPKSYKINGWGSPLWPRLDRNAWGSLIV